MLELKKEQEVMQVHPLCATFVLCACCRFALCTFVHVHCCKVFFRFCAFFTSLHSLYSHSIYSDLYSRLFSLKVRLDNIKLKNRLKKREMQLKAKVSVKRKC